MSEVGLSAIHVHLSEFSPKNQESRYYSYTHLLDEETGSQRMYVSCQRLRVRRWRSAVSPGCLAPRLRHMTATARSPPRFHSSLPGGPLTSSGSRARASACWRGKAGTPRVRAPVAPSGPARQSSRRGIYSGAERMCVFPQTKTRIPGNKRERETASGRRKRSEVR